MLNTVNIQFHQKIDLVNIQLHLESDH